MSIDEFRKMSRIAKIQASVAAIGIFVPWFVVVFVVLLPRAEPAPPLVLSFLVCALVAACLFIPLWLFMRAVARKHGLICPHCGQWLMGTYADFVLKTGRCCKCKAEIFTDAQHP